jgi:hypothetical protein
MSERPVHQHPRRLADWINRVPLVGRRTFEK